MRRAKDVKPGRLEAPAHVPPEISRRSFACLQRRLNSISTTSVFLERRAWRGQQMIIPIFCTPSSPPASSFQQTSLTTLLSPIPRMVKRAKLPIPRHWMLHVSEHAAAQPSWRACRLTWKRHCMIPTCHLRANVMCHVSATSEQVVIDMDVGSVHSSSTVGTVLSVVVVACRYK